MNCKYPPWGLINDMEMSVYLTIIPRARMGSESIAHEAVRISLFDFGKRPIVIY